MGLLSSPLGFINLPSSAPVVGTDAPRFTFNTGSSREAGGTDAPRFTFNTGSSREAGGTDASRFTFNTGSSREAGGEDGGSPSVIGLILSQAIGALNEHFPLDKLGGHSPVEFEFEFEEVPHGSGSADLNLFG